MKKLLVFAAMVLVLGGLFVGFGFYVQSKAAREATPAAQNFHDADARLLADEVMAQGNSPRAVLLAHGMAAELNRDREDRRARGRLGPFSQTEGPFRVWCELHDTYCAFLVFASGLPATESKVVRAQAELAWSTALVQLDDHPLRIDLEMAVALRGTHEYGPIRIGKTDSDDDPTAYDGKPAAIYRFFVRPGDPR